MGLLGKPTMIQVGDLEKLCKEHSTKDVKANVRDQVKFEFKEKGKKPVVTKGIALFSITGKDFQVEKIVESLKQQNVSELE